MSKILEIKNLTHVYEGSGFGRFAAIEDVSFSVEEGEIVGIIGHTGSGKTTLVEHLNGLLKPTSGTVFLEGKDIFENKKNMKYIRSQIGLVFQYPEYQLFEETVFDDIAYGPKNLGLKGEELKQRVIHTCKTVGIPLDHLDKSPFDLSGGEKRRVAIAGVMAMQPKVIIFDEPISGLDPKSRKSIIKMIDDYRKSAGATVLIISHNMDDMAQLADKLLVMNKGKLVRFDTTVNVFKDSKFLKEIGLDIPTVGEIFQKLIRKGLNLPDDIFTIDKAVSYLCDLKLRGDAND
ncbi:MAG: energy-coupling factor transporter ATPase [Clostridia bacterium]|nr:energy-coupling factor transporter ATPase [Clostridia bacterium]